MNMNISINISVTNACLVYCCRLILHITTLNAIFTTKIDLHTNFYLTGRLLHTVGQSSSFSFAVISFTCIVFSIPLYSLVTLRYPRIFSLVHFLWYI